MLQRSHPQSPHSPDHRELEAIVRNAMISLLPEIVEAVHLKAAEGGTNGSMASRSSSNIMEAPTTSSGGGHEWGRRHFKSYYNTQIGKLEADALGEGDEEDAQRPVPEEATYQLLSSASNDTRRASPTAWTWKRCVAAVGLSTIHQYLQSFIEDDHLEKIVGFLVLVNCFVIGLETDLNARFPGEPVPEVLHWLDLVFCILFSIDLSLRILVNPYQFFYLWGDNFAWNVFDVIVVSFQIFENAGQRNDAHLGVFRTVRLVRIMRLLRVVRLFQELRTIGISMLSSMTSLVWAMMLLGVVNFMFAVVFCQLVADSGPGTPHQADLERWFGSLWWSVLTMLECVVGGVSWDSVIYPLITDISPGVGILFICYVLFCLFAVMNGVTAVFVNKLTTLAAQDKATTLANQLRDLFFKDVPKTQRSQGPVQDVSRDEFLKKVNEPEMEEYFRAIDMDPSEAGFFFELLDIDGSGGLSREEIVDGCLRLSGPAQAVDVALLMRETGRMFAATNKLQEQLADVTLQLRELTSKLEAPR